ncbi:Por secretion system C-terminal sorting domain-containing protein [Dyadobacter soli]|uniref:Por secretion system C-terminal sorting domain-containing protein n=1 Tax=Dyadobacter soli TaxID=659014 RepID=A0A1G7D4W7_9BACT|nr:GEVED domain-containing protein [Dyadobacter soli]SDE46642.1 Por secretion system C-terminal sorting domain-containing protein [Dyadobacter soli]
MENLLLPKPSFGRFARWLLFMLFAAVAVQAQPLLNESFNHTGGTLLSAANWAVRASGTPAISVTAGNLAVASTIGNDFGNKASLASSGQDVYRNFTAANATTYNSMVVNVSAAQATGDYFYILGNSTSPLVYGARVYIRSNGAGFSFGISRGAATAPVYETTVRNFNTNYFIVLKYEVVTGTTNDLAKLFVSSAALASEPATASIEYGASTGEDITASVPLSSVNLYQGTAANAPSLQIDGINVGTTWASVSSAQYDYGDAPTVYDQSKDGIYMPGVHIPLAGFRLGVLAPSASLAPQSVSAGADNNTPNGDGAEEDGLAVPIESVKQGLAYSITVPVTSPSTATKYLYAWIDFNNNGKFELGELTTATLNFTATGATTRTLTWTAAQTGAIPAGTEKLYMRLRLSGQVLYDFTTAASGGATLDERSIGNGAMSAAVVNDAGTTPTGEIEDYQVTVARLYDFGDLPVSFERDKDNNLVPAQHGQLAGLSIGSIVDTEAAPYSVGAGENNNESGDNDFDQADEDGITEFPSVSRNVIYSIDVPVNSPPSSGTKYLYGWLDLNGDGRFQSGEFVSTSTATAGATTLTLNWSASLTNSIAAGTKSIYLRLRLSNTALNDYTTATSGALGALIDERSIGNGATSATNATLLTTVALGEVEDYLLRLDDYDFGDAPAAYENGVPARQIALPTRHIGAIVQYESAANSVASGTDNNGANGDGDEEDGLSGSSPVITKGAPFSFSVPVTVTVASNVIAWIDFNNDGKFQLDEAAYNAATGATIGYQSQAIGTSTKTFWFRGTQTNRIPAGTSNVYVRIRLTQTAGADDAGTTAIDERSIGDGASNGSYGTPSVGEVEDYRFAVITDLDYGDAPLEYERNQADASRPARNHPTDDLFIGQAFVLESGPASVTLGAGNNAPNGDGDEEDGISNNQLFVRLGGAGNTNVYSVEVNNTTGAAATLHGWIDFNNNGRFELAEYASIGVSTGTTGPVSLPFTATQATNIPASATKLYMRLRLAQANVEAALGDAANATLDERSIADGLATGEYTSVAAGEVEDYQLTIIKDYGDVPVSYENSNPAFQSNSVASELHLGAAVDYEMASQAITAPNDNNGTNGDGADEDAVAQQQTITVGAPFTLTVPVTSTSAGTKSIYAWIDFNGDGIFNGNEVATPITLSAVAGVTNVTLTWTSIQTNSISPTVVSNGKTYVRIRLSASALTNTNSGTLTSIDTRSFGPGNFSGEVEDYQFLVSNLSDYGDAPISFEANATNAQLPARQAASNTLRLGLTVDNESSAASVSSPNDNNEANGDGADEDGITNLAPIYSGVAYRTQVSVLNNTGSSRTLHGWIDFNGDGRFGPTEYASVAIPASLNQQTTTLSWPATAISAAKVYMRLRITEGTVTDGAGALVDERSIGDGASTGLYTTLLPGEIEDYQLTVIAEYDYGDAAAATYDNSRSNVFSPARQAVSQGLFLGELYPDAEPSKQSTVSTASGDNLLGKNDEDGATPGPVTDGGGYTLNVRYTNNSGAARTLYGWVDFNNNERFEAGEMASVSLTDDSNNGIATLTWTPAQSNTIPAGVSLLYMRLRTSEATLTDFTTGVPGGLVDERALADGHNSGEYQATPVIANGEIEDYTITVTTDLDYGDVPASYEQPGGSTRPARQISSSALQIGGLADVEPTAQSVASGADNNGTNGDGADEDGIVPGANPVTVGTAFTLSVRVTNTSGTARTLYGWLDMNGNGVFDDGEVAGTTPSVANGTNNGLVNLVWTAASTLNIQSDKVYLRLRLADLALTNNTATTYDERAFADGLTTGDYAAAAARGEIEDYQLAVIPVFDYGDAPVSFEQNSVPASVPARHKTLATMYLGSTSGLETSPANVAAGNDNNNANGDGADEDGITSIPTLYPGGSYNVPVSLFKSISGTGTIHGWLDLNGDGRFSVNEYTSATVSAATGAQSTSLLWPAAIYTGSGSHTYLRLRFTTGALSDNAATTLVDERSIGDGLSSGIYGTAPVNGEVEDYQITVDNTGTPSIPVCEGLGSIDPIQAGFHATMVRPASGGYLIFGEIANGNGTTNIVTPVPLLSGSNGFNFSGDLLMATLGSSSAFTYTQYFALTTAGLYAWGARGIVVPTAVTTSTAMQPISLPPGVTPARVRMIDAGTSYMTENFVGDQTNMNGSLVLLTTNGEVWVRSSVNAASTTNDFNAVQGDGNLLTNNSSTDWHQVQTAEGVPLTGMIDVRTTGAVAIATNGTAFYTWGRNVYSGDGSATITQHYAIQMATPSGFSGPAKKVDLGYGRNVSASYYILDNTGVVHVLGNNGLGQLGVGSLVEQTTWTKITTKNQEPDEAGNQADASSPIGVVTGISANNHDSSWGHLILITQDKRAYHAGSNAGGSTGGGMSGTVSPTSWSTPTAMTTASGAQMLPGKIVYGEAGGHIGVLAKEGSDRYGYVGHTVSGSDGCNGCTASPAEYNFDKTTSTGPLCGIEAYDYGDLDNRYNAGDKARHQIKYAQVANPLRLGVTAPDSEDEPQVTSAGNENEANGDDVDSKGDDEDAFTAALPAKTAGQPYSVQVPLTNNTGTTANLYGFIDWNADGVFSASETVVVAVAPSSTAQNVTMTWPDPGFEVASCSGDAAFRRSFVRLRLTTSALTDNTGTPVDERSYATATDGEVEDYYLDWQPPAENFDYGNLPTSAAPVIWPQASASLLSLDLSNTTRVWLGNDTSYPDKACVSNIDRNGGLGITASGTPVTGDGTVENPFVIKSSGSPVPLAYSVTVNGNTSTSTPVYWAIWYDANGNGNFTDADDLFNSGVTNHGSPVTVSELFTFNPGGSNAGATNGAIRIVATATNTSFSKGQNGTVAVQNGEVEDYYVVYNAAQTVSGTVFNDNNGQTGGANGTVFNGTATPVFANLYDQAGNFVASAPVNASGVYTFTDVPAGTGYQVQISASADTTGSTIPTGATLPGAFENVSSNGETGNHTDGLITFDVADANVTGLDFGINEAPTAVASDPATQANPGGTTSVDVTDGFSGTDPNSGTIVSMTITEFPTGATSISVDSTTYYPTAGDIPGGCANCAVFPPAGVTVTTSATGVPTQTIGVDPAASGVTSVHIPFTVTDNAGLVSTPTTLNVPFAEALTISGTIFNDASGIAGTPANTVDGTPIESASNQPLHANLFTATGVFVATVPVDASGNYSFVVTAGTDYLVTVSSTPADSSSTPSTATALPSGWLNTGENVGSGAGSDGTPNGILPVTVGTTSVPNANLGIQQEPTADPKEFTVGNAAFSQTPPAGFPSETGYQTIPASSSSLTGYPTNGSLSGSDPEDCINAGTCNTGTGTTFNIDSVNPNTILYYDFGGATGIVRIDSTSGVVTIPNFDITKLVIYGQNGSGVAGSSFGFTYSITDQAGATSTSVPYSISTSGPLPVTLIAFNASQEEEAVKLKWVTTSEVNSKAFEIQRSTNATHWTVIGSVNSQSQDGSSVNRLDYDFNDVSPNKGVNYYRLKMIDLDGKFGYSQIKSVWIDKSGHLVAYPNPVSNGKLMIDVAGKDSYDAEILNLSGIRVYRQNLGTGRQLNVSNLAAGVYVLRVKSVSGDIQTTTFVID